MRRMHLRSRQPFALRQTPSAPRRVFDDLQIWQHSSGFVMFESSAFPVWLLEGEFARGARKFSFGCRMPRFVLRARAPAEVPHVEPHTRAALRQSLALTLRPGVKPHIHVSNVPRP